LLSSNLKADHRAENETAPNNIKTLFKGKISNIKPAMPEESIYAKDLEVRNKFIISTS